MASAQSTKPNQPSTIFVVSHTHWDRAWYLPFEGFRVKLVDMLDELLDELESNPQFKHFHFDGQVSPFEDYLEIKPQHRERIKALAASGRLAIGPCYVLPDLFLVSGESLVRNLLIGSRMAAELGGSCPIGYVPDSFGHVSQMPQLLKGFGIDSYFFSRGRYQRMLDLGHEFWWVAPNGRDRVMAIVQHRGYCAGPALGHPNGDMSLHDCDYEIGRNQLDFLVKDMLPHALSGVGLINNGVDHYPVQRSLPGLIEYVNHNNDGSYHLQHGSLADYLAAVLPTQKNWGSYQGELRGAAEHVILSGVYSARTYLKQMNARCQVLLERQLEPLAVIMDCLGTPYPAAMIRHAWRTLLKNHPHDDICGCSVDSTHRDMVTRFHKVEQIAQALQVRFQHNDHGLLERLLYAVGLPNPVDETYLLVFNALPYQRSENCCHVLQVPCPPQTRPEDLVLLDQEGCEVSARFREIPPHHQLPPAWGEQNIKRFEVKFAAQDIPAGGYQVLRVKTISKKSTRPTANPAFDLRPEKNTFQNPWWKLQVKPDGQVKIVDRRTKQVCATTNLFEDLGDRGDEYDFDPLANEKPVVSSGQKLKVAYDCQIPHTLTISISQELRVPAQLNPNRKQRSKQLVRIPITTEMVLYDYMPRIDLNLRLDQKACDHRLRLGFKVPWAVEHVWSASKFDVVSHPAGGEQEQGWLQPPKPTQPQDEWTAVETRDRGLAVFNQGLSEYEVQTRRSSATCWVTLVRAVGWLSRSDLKTRKGDAGPSLAAPEAQCLGEFQARLAILPYSGSWEDAEVPYQALAFSSGFQTVSPAHNQLERFASQAMPWRHSFYAINNPRVLFSACKQTEDGDGSVIRVWNPGTTPEQAEIKFDRELSKVWRVRLDETGNETIKFSKAQNSVTINVEPKEIVTIKPRFKRS